MIDKKGRIFGKINIIDLVVVILVICLAGSVFYNVFEKKVNENITVQEKENGLATITFKIYGIYPEWVETLKEGDKLIVADTVTDVEIISVVRETSKTTTTTAEGKIVVAENPMCVDCTIVVRGSANRDALGVTIMEQLYRVSDSREIRTGTFASMARVLDIQFEPAQ